MKKGYVYENTLQVNVTIDLGEINDMIAALEPLTTEEGNKNWKAREIVTKLRTMRREAAEEARREFENMLQKV